MCVYVCVFGLVCIIIIIIITLFASFSHQRYLVVFQWNLSDCKSPQVFRTLLSILLDPYNDEVCMVSILPPDLQFLRSLFQAL